MAELTPRWRKRGYDLDFGAGIALGYATCGEVGFDGRSDYAAIGAVTNLASRLADEATAGQILIEQRLYAEVEDDVEVEPIGRGDAQGLPAPDLGVQRRCRAGDGSRAISVVDKSDFGFRQETAFSGRLLCESGVRQPSGWK